MMGIPHPIPYQGSKRKLAKTILACFPQDTNRLIEPFAGSAAITLAAAYCAQAQSFVLNDLNSALIELWQLIINCPNKIAHAYEKLWNEQHDHERAFYDKVRAQFNKTHRPDYFLYLLVRCVKSAVRYNMQGEFNQSPDNRRKGTRPATMTTNISTASQLLKGKTLLTADDYKRVVLEATPADLVYMDPPYQGVSGKRDQRYIEGLVFDEFVETLDLLNMRQISFLVSYDGRTGAKQHGKPLPDCLKLTQIELEAGKSSQATLLGRSAKTVESLYLSAALVARLNNFGTSKRLPISFTESQSSLRQLTLFEDSL